MGLKNIHLVFISMAVALCVAFASWALWMYRDGGQGGYLAAAAVAFSAAVGLILYGSWFLKKMKGLHTP
ncbi:MAG TPA: hypothetical protein VL049_21860 [Candidatus Dormibacteraeota bacterium]|nr:hypothetical protein [Candidatus Dormibacteraeota bacterium]